MNERINIFIKHLNISVSAFEKQCNLSNGAVSKIGYGTRRSTIDKISKSYPQLNVTWLLTGAGEMLNDTENENVPVVQGGGNIRYWEDVNATCGNVDFLMNPDEHQTRMIDVPNFSDCSDAVNIYGDSMFPLYKNGEIIILKDWQENFIDFGNTYLIVTKNGNRMVKTIKKGSTPDKVLCVSYNSNFDSFEIELADIQRLFIVKGSIRKDAL